MVAVRARPGGRDVHRRGPGHVAEGRRGPQKEPKPAPSRGTLVLYLGYLALLHGQLGLWFWSPRPWGPVEWAAKLACAMAVLVFEVMTVRWVALELRRVRPGWPALPLAIALVLLVVVPAALLPLRLV